MCTSTSERWGVMKIDLSLKILQGCFLIQPRHSKLLLVFFKVKSSKIRDFILLKIISIQERMKRKWGTEISKRKEEKLEAEGRKDGRRSLKSGLIIRFQRSNFVR